MNGEQIFLLGILLLFALVSSAPIQVLPTSFLLTLPSSFSCPLFVRKRRQLLPDGFPEPKHECRTDADCRVLHPFVPNIKCCYSGGIQGLPFKCFNVGPAPIPIEQTRPIPTSSSNNAP